jgi:hypothetical protein
MVQDRGSSQTLYEAKPILLILIGTVLLLMFGDQFEFSALLFILSGALIAKLRLNYRNPASQRHGMSRSHALPHRHYS